jgi:hypothetical protein
MGRTGAIVSSRPTKVLLDFSQLLHNVTFQSWIFNEYSEENLDRIYWIL